MADSPVYWAEGDDEEMAAATRRAKETFKYFWRELSWEQRRIVPALDLAAVKAAFSDDEDDPDAPVEHMWVNELTFDGQVMVGALVNQPNQLTSVTQGDPVPLDPEQLEDWMVAIDGKVYGAFTVHVLRARMSAEERAQHDEAWGLDFGDPATPRIVRGDDLDAEHPMSDNMAPSLDEQLQKDRSLLTAPDEDGLTLLHHLALAGSEACVRVALAHGADRNVRSASNATPLDLAKLLGWPKVVALLQGPT
jgi:uncharacterized protein YegJ (DUF2314 family)